MRNGKRILSVTIFREADSSPDTSHLGEYGNRPESKYAIDRAHSEDCAALEENHREAADKLERIRQHVADMHNAILAQYNGTLANEKLDAERADLDNAYDKLGELQEDVMTCDCGFSGYWNPREYRYFNPCWENYKGEPEADIRKYCRQDFEQMEGLNAGDWCYLGITAEAEIAVDSYDQSSYKGTGHLCQTITSGGLWGIESNSDKEYIESVEKDELAELREQLIALGFSRRTISKAFRTVEHKDR